MNFDDAIAAHVRWKTRLRTFLDGAGETLDSATTAKDNVCDLGQWIYGPGTTYTSHAEYEQVKAEHRAFHRCAAAVVKKVEDGNRKAAEDMLAAGSSFADASTRTVNAIQKLRKRLGAA